MRNIILLTLILFSLSILAAPFPFAGVVTDNSQIPIKEATIEYIGEDTATLTDSMGGYGDYLTISSKTGNSGFISSFLNPSIQNNKLSFHTQSEGESFGLKIIDTRGRIIFEKNLYSLAKGLNHFSIPLETTAQNIYFAKINTSNKEYILKVVNSNSTESSSHYNLKKSSQMSRAENDSLKISKHGYTSKTIEALKDVNKTTLEKSDHLSCTPTYVEDQGNSWHYVGQDQYINTFRGLYWVGESKSICKVDINLNYKGDISDLDYKVTVWDVDIDNNLELTKKIATSDTVSGAEVEAGGSWVTFTFPEPVTITSGKNVVLISRSDTTSYSVENILSISNNYDMNDEENRQFNVHYSGSKLAGRKPGDEDQPEPFAFGIKMYGVNQLVKKTSTFPAAPMNISISNDNTDRAVITWDNFNLASTITGYKIYAYNMSDASLTPYGESSSTTFTSEVLSSGTYNFVVTSISENGNESYHTNIASITIE